MSKKLSAYLSHQIRGPKGETAAQQDIDTNNRAAIKFADTLRLLFPALDLYVPAEHDEVLSILWRKKYITIDQLLEADCKILAKRNFLIVYMPDGFMSNGMSKELQFAQANNIPYQILTEPNILNVNLLAHFIDTYFRKG